MTKLAVLLWVATLATAIPSSARAEDDTRLPIKIETHVGLQDPFGTFGLALAYDHGGRLAGGVGVGLDDLEDDTLPPIGIFGRLRLVNWGWGSVGVGLALSRAVQTDDGYYSERYVQWSWRPSYRATGTLGLELVAGPISMRLDAGIGRILNEPTCASYVSAANGIAYEPCKEADLPAVMALIGDQRTVGSLTATVGYRFGRWSTSPTAALPPTEKDPLTARRLSLWSTLGTAAVGATTLAIAVSGDDGKLGLAGGGLAILGLAYGPAIGYLYAGEAWRGLGVGTLRTIGLVGGSLLFATGITFYDSDHPDTPDKSGRQLLGIAAVGTCLVSTIYDIVKAPDAARRANEKRAKLDVAVVPALIRTADTRASGAALVGRF